MNGPIVLPILLVLLFLLGCGQNNASLSRLRDAKNASEKRTKKDVETADKEEDFKIVQDLLKSEPCEVDGYQVCLELVVKLPEDTVGYLENYSKRLPVVLGASIMEKSRLRVHFVDRMDQERKLAGYTFTYRYDSLVGVEMD
ncbi:MAG: hypothetical protein AAGA66_04115 [Bacteroidota bacterium]